MATVASFEAVARTARMLQRRGEKPSVRGIQAALGGGSTTTIQKYLKQWQQAMAERAERDPVPDALHEVAEEVWQQALDQADARFAEQRIQWDADRAASLAERDRLTARITGLEAERDAAQRATRDVDDARRVADATLQRLTEERDRLRGLTASDAQRLAALDHERNDMRQQQAELLAALRSQHEQDLDSLRRAQTSAEDRLMQQLDAERQRVKAADKAVGRLEQTLLAERQALSDQRDAQQAAHQHAMRELLEQCAAERELRATAAAEATLRADQVAQLEAKNLTLGDALQAATAAVARLEERLDRLQVANQEASRKASV